MENYKNALQHTQQVNGQPLPQYDTRIVNGASHIPMWQSSVTIPEKGAFRGHQAPTRKAAEQSAAARAIAQQATDDFSNRSLLTAHSRDIRISAETPSLTRFRATNAGRAPEPALSNDSWRTPATFDDGAGSSRTLHATIVVDAENCGGELKHLENTPGNIDVVCIISRLSPVPHGSAKTITMPSTGKESADVGITLYIATQLPSSRIFYILTRDRFAIALKDNAPAFFPSPQIFVFSSAAEILRDFEQRPGAV